MSEFEDLAPDDSISQQSIQGSSLRNGFASKFGGCSDNTPIPPCIHVIDGCKVVVNTPACLSAIKPFLNKVNIYLTDAYI